MIFLLRKKFFKEAFMIKFVATDIDGTIFIPEKEFTSGVKDCISKLSKISKL